jgi:hypothetical protein
MTHRIVEAVNHMWSTLETPEVKYRTLPADDGYLYVTPGVFGECRCSDVEARLGDHSGDFDYDDHHFRHTELPSDVREKTILYDESGILRERKLIGDIHPLFEGMFVHFEVVD